MYKQEGLAKETEMAAIYNLKATIESGQEIKVTRKTCYGDHAVSNERNHIRTMAPRGSSITFEVTPVR
jgi:hypothetical protein